MPISEPTMLDHALAYAARGWRVVPCYVPTAVGCSCGTADCPYAGKHPTPPHGLLHGTTSERQIRSWWAAVPDANLAIVTGAASGLIALDIDVAHDGLAGLALLEARLGPLPPTLRARTGSGGEHRLYAHPGGMVRNSVGALAPGVDMRGDRGYIIAPPSLHASGHTYAWLDELPVATLPDTWIAVLAAAPAAPTLGMPHAPDEGDGDHWLDQALLQARQGTRNATGFWLACQLRDAGYDEAQAARYVEDYARRLGGDYTVREALHALDQAYRRPAREAARSQETRAPLYVVGDEDETEMGGDEDEREEDGATPEADQATTETLNLTDLGNARRLAAGSGADLRYVPEWGWLGWNGRHWMLDPTGVAERAARVVVDNLYREARALRKKKLPKAAARLAKWAFMSESSGRLDAMVHQARYDRALVARPEQFDADPWLLTCANGTLDLHTGQLRPHAREDFATKASSVTYDPDAPSPHWQAFLERVLPDADVRAFVQRYAGYTLTGSTDEQCLVFLYGPGGNGKSTLVGFLQRVLGEFATQTPPETLMIKQQGGGIPNDIATLAGRRMVTTIEVEDGKRLAESLIKSLTGQDLVTARFLHREFFTFQPAFKVWFAANHKPIIRGTDHAIWRRIHLIPFTVQITEAERKANPQFKEQLSAELPGILRWAVEGCMAWQEHGLAPPSAVSQATAHYRSEMDTLNPFIDECCEMGRGKEVYAGTLYRAFTDWCSDNGEEPLKQRTFGMKLSERSLERDRGTNGKHVWRGIALKRGCGYPRGALTLVNDPNDPNDQGIGVADTHTRARSVKTLNKGHLGHLGNSGSDNEEF